VAQMPAISEIIRQFGLDIPTFLGLEPERFLQLEPAVLNIFHVPEAKGSPFLPEQDSLIIPYQIKSVLGFGGLLPSGSLFAVVMFLKVKIPQSTAEMFKNLAPTVKKTLSVYDEKSVFEPSLNPNNIVTINNVSETQLLDFQVANLIQLLEFSEQEMLRQAARFQRTIDKLQGEIASRKNKEEALKASQEPFTGLVNIAQDGIVPIDKNQGLQRFNQGEELI
jgi:hypothetical protein